ncbi:MAG TPA: MarR family winged helix-turn-helix transcriptional regulator, partial [Gemmatimonadales bacterium]|nr:MarR family winged helix-turn-helix transcriptional regulator [Gemmatimonadales bacterium]
ADHLGLQLPTASKLADLLLRRGEITRREDLADRRRNRMALTPAGRAKLDLAMGAVRQHLQQRLSGLSAADQQAVLRAMQILDPLVRPAAASSDPPPAAVPTPHAPTRRG